MKIFKAKDGRLLQLADIERIKSWNPEMPLIFIGDVREKRIPIYKKQFSGAIVKEIEAYLDLVLKDVAIPKLINAIQSPDDVQRMQIAENFLQISQSNPDLLKIALNHIESAIEKENTKSIKTKLSNTLLNYKKAQKRKQTAKKRTQLRELSKKMTKLDRDFADGTITNNDYLKERKIFVDLQKEIELAEAVD